MRHVTVWGIAVGLAGCAGPVLRPDLELDATRAALRASLTQPVVAPDPEPPVRVREADGVLPVLERPSVGVASPLEAAAAAAAAAVLAPVREVDGGGGTPGDGGAGVAGPSEPIPVPEDASEATGGPPTGGGGGFPAATVAPSAGGVVGGTGPSVGAGPSVGVGPSAPSMGAVAPPVGGGTTPWWGGAPDLVRAVEGLTRAVEEQRLLHLVQLASGHPAAGVRGAPSVDDGRLAALEREVAALSTSHGDLRREVEAAVARLADDVEEARRSEREWVQARLDGFEASLDARLPTDLAERLAGIEASLERLPDVLTSVVEAQEDLAERVRALEAAPASEGALAEQVAALADTQVEILDALNAWERRRSRSLDEAAVRRIAEEVAGQRGAGSGPRWRWPWSRVRRDASGAEATPPTPPSPSEPEGVAPPSPPSDVLEETTPSSSGAGGGAPAEDAPSTDVLEETTPSSSGAGGDVPAGPNEIPPASGPSIEGPDASDDPSDESDASEQETTP